MSQHPPRKDAIIRSRANHHHATDEEGEGFPLRHAKKPVGEEGGGYDEYQW